MIISKWIFSPRAFNTMIHTLYRTNLWSLRLRYNGSWLYVQELVKKWEKWLINCRQLSTLVVVDAYALVVAKWVSPDPPIRALHWNYIYSERGLKLIIVAKDNKSISEISNACRLWIYFTLHTFELVSSLFALNNRIDWSASEAHEFCGYHTHIKHQLPECT